MITANSMNIDTREGVAIEIVARTVLNGIGTVDAGTIHTVSPSAARLLLSLGKAKPAPMKTARKSKTKPD